MKKRSEKNIQNIPSPKKIKRKLINDRSNFSIVEAYKTARTNLMFTRVGEGCQKIVVTSSLESEGHTR